eukprot:COSAG06_NODE_3618_length_5113_cov_26.588353_7_plen_118_part_00
MRSCLSPSASARLIISTRNPTLGTAAPHLIEEAVRDGGQDGEEKSEPVCAAPAQLIASSELFMVALLSSQLALSASQPPQSLHIVSMASWQPSGQVVVCQRAVVRIQQQTEHVTVAV